MKAGWSRWAKPNPQDRHIEADHYAAPVAEDLAIIDASTSHLAALGPDDRLSPRRPRVATAMIAPDQSYTGRHKPEQVPLRQTEAVPD
jgi:hypothetical protein